MHLVGALRLPAISLDTARVGRKDHDLGATDRLIHWLANMYHSRRYDGSKGCLTQLSLTEFISALRHALAVVSRLPSISADARRRQKILDAIVIYHILNANSIAATHSLDIKSTGTRFLWSSLRTSIFVKIQRYQEPTHHLC